MNATEIVLETARLTEMDGKAHSFLVLESMETVTGHRVLDCKKRRSQGVPG